MRGIGFALLALFWQRENIRAVDCGAKREAFFTSWLAALAWAAAVACIVAGL